MHRFLLKTCSYYAKEIDPNFKFLNYVTAYNVAKYINDKLLDTDDMDEEEKKDTIVRYVKYCIRHRNKDKDNIDFAKLILNNNMVESFKLRSKSEAELERLKLISSENYEEWMDEICP